MNHSGFDFTDLHSPGKAVGYASSETAIPASVVDSSVSFSAGAIYTTVGDLYKWDRAFLAGSILSPASQQKAYTPYLARYGYGWVIGVADGKKMVQHISQKGFEFSGRANASFVFRACPGLGRRYIVCARRACLAFFV